MGGGFRIPGGEGAISLIALAMLCALIWFGGEYLKIDRQIIILAILGVGTLAVFALLLGRVLAARRARKIEQQLRIQAQAQLESVTPDRQSEVQELEKQFHEALGALKGSKMGKSALYTLPWYIIIGPPGAGKSTALQESGLNFPNIGSGPKSIRGIGGTRNCDWWFTDEGILLDTAGRYTTQVEDQKEWFAFLDLLKRSRKHKPINGAIVAVSISDLVGATSEEIDAHAQTIRDRLDELTKQLQLVFPVYLMFTKCDLLSGFSEFFEDYARPERSQVWGFSLPYSGPHRNAREAFDQETAAMAQRLRLRRISVLANDRPVKKRHSSYVFPLQFEKARAPLAEFVGALFKPNPFQESAVLRGVYFSSGTQKGIPIDQVLAAMGEAFQMTEEATTMQQSTVEKKSFFLKDLFTRVIFPDQHLARGSAGVLRTRALVRTVSAVGSLGLFVLVLAYLITSFVGNQGLIAGMENAIKRVNEAQTTKATIAEQLAALDELRAQLAVVDDYRLKGLPPTLGFGLYRGEDAARAGRKVYDVRLKDILLTDAAIGIAAELDRLRAKPDKKSADYDELYDLHRVWRMLAGEQKPPEPELVARVLKKEGRWGANLKDASPQVQQLVQAQLGFVVTQLDRVGDFKIAYDKALDERVGDELTGALWIPQQYEAIINSRSDSFGVVGGDMLIRNSPGRELIKFGVTFSGIYTQKAYDDFVKNAIADQSKDLASKFAQLKDKKPPDEIAKRLRDIYAADFRRNWDGMLDKLSVVEFNDCADAVNKLRQLTAADAPHRELFRNIWAQRSLKADAEVLVAAPADDLKWLDEAFKALTVLMGEMDTMVRGTQSQRRVIPYLNQGKLQGLVDAFDKCAKDLDVALNAADPSISRRALSVMRDIWDQARKALQKEAQAEADVLWNSTVAQPFRDGMAGRFPFDESSAQDVTLTAFARMFNPKSGTLWSTWAVLDKLDDFVIGQPLISFSQSFKDCMAKATSIRTTMFKPDGETISVPFGVRFDSSPGVADIRLAFPGTMNNGSRTDIGLNDRPDRRFDVIWADGTTQGGKLSIRVGETQSQWVAKDYTDKPWGLLRLLREGKASRVDDMSFVVQWQFEAMVAGRRLSYDIKLTIVGREADYPLKEKYFAGFMPPLKTGP